MQVSEQVEFSDLDKAIMGGVGLLGAGAMLHRRRKRKRKERAEKEAASKRQADRATTISDLEHTKKVLGLAKDVAKDSFKGQAYTSMGRGIAGIDSLVTGTAKGLGSAGRKAGAAATKLGRKAAKRMGMGESQSSEMIDLVLEGYSPDDVVTAGLDAAFGDMDESVTVGGTTYGPPAKVAGGLALGGLALYGLHKRGQRKKAEKRQSALSDAEYAAKKAKADWDSMKYGALSKGAQMLNQMPQSVQHAAQGVIRRLPSMRKK